MSSTTQGSGYVAEPIQVGIIAWSGMDLTDFAAPCEVLSHASNTSREKLVSLVVASEEESSQTSQGVKVGRDIDIDALLDRLESIDVLIIPGGAGFTADSVPAAPGLKKALNAYVDLPPRNASQSPRTVVSICAGAFFLAEIGLLAGRAATAHYAFLGEIQKLADRHGKGTKIVRQHYVDQGVNEAKNLQTITSGGVTSGFDATLYLLEINFGLAVAEKSRATMDAVWRREMTPFGFMG